MDKGIINILKNHGCLYMAYDYKELIEEIETYVKDREKQCAINGVVKSFYCQDENYHKIEKCKEQCITCFSKNVDY